MRKEVIVELINKLVGSIEPIGETNYDNRVFENQESIIFIVDELISQLLKNAQMENVYEYSVERVVFKAQEYLNELKKCLDYYNFEEM